MRRLGRWMINALTALSLLMCFGTATAWVFSEFMSSRVTFPLVGNARVTIQYGDLSLHNQAVPYRGSIINVGSTALRATRISLPGVYFRRFVWPNVTYWTLTLPLGGVVIVTALLPLTRAVRPLWRSAPAPVGRCPHCGYDVRATPDRCPECGTAAKGAAT